MCEIENYKFIIKFHFRVHNYIQLNLVNASYILCHIRQKQYHNLFTMPHRTTKVTCFSHNSHT